MDEIIETAKATQEVAKTVSKGMDIAKSFGQFISGPIEQLLGLLEDKLKYTRWKNQLEIYEKIEELRIERNLQIITPLPPSIGIQFFEKAAIEDDSYLQSLWARMLVNSVSRENDFNFTKTYINILEELSPMQAQVLLTIYSMNVDLNVPLETHLLPDIINAGSSNEQPIENIQIILENFLRLNLISLAALTIGGGQDYSSIHQTLLGKNLTASLQ